MFEPLANGIMLIPTLSLPPPKLIKCGSFVSNFKPVPPRSVTSNDLSYKIFKNVSRKDQGKYIDKILNWLQLIWECFVKSVSNSES